MLGVVPSLWSVAAALLPLPAALLWLAAGFGLAFLLDCLVGATKKRNAKILGEVLGYAERGTLGGEREGHRTGGARSGLRRVSHRYISSGNHGNVF